MKPQLLVALAFLFALTPGYSDAGSGQAPFPVRIGILNYETTEILGSQWQDFEDVLEGHLPEYDFHISLLDNQQLNEAVASRNLDFVLTTSGNYVLLHYQYGLSSPLASLVRQHQGKPLRAYGAVIFTRSDRQDIQQLSDLSDKRIATIGTGGFAGYQVQAHTILQATGNKLTEQQLLVTGQPQAKVIQAVMEGEADVGFVRSGLLETRAAKGHLDLQQLKVLNAQLLPGYPFQTSTLLYPEWPIAAMPHTDRSLTNKVAGILLSLSRDGKPVTERIFGFDIPADYLATEQLLRELRAAPFDTPIKVTFADVWSSYKPHAIAIIVITLILLTGIAVFARLSQALANARDTIEQEHDRLANILWGTNAGTWEWDVPSGTVEFNERWAEIIGYRLDELQPLSIDTWTSRAHPEDLQRSNDELQKAFEKKASAYECEVRMKHKDGRWVWVLDRGRVTEWSTEGRPLKMAGTHTDITDLKDYEKKLERIATSDSLTGLHNRYALMDRLRHALAVQRRRGGYLAIVFLDLDGFKAVNDTYGHEAGDQLLVQIGERFKNNVREEDTVARMGGDEFVVLISGLQEPDACFPQVERLLAAASEDARINGATVNVSASAGITIAPQASSPDSSELLRQADSAMYDAKKRGKNTYAFAEEIDQSKQASVD